MDTDKTGFLIRVHPCVSVAYNQTRNSTLSLLKSFDATKKPMAA